MDRRAAIAIAGIPTVAAVCYYGAELAIQQLGKESTIAIEKGEIAVLPFAAQTIGQCEFITRGQNDAELYRDKAWLWDRNNPWDIIEQHRADIALITGKIPGKDTPTIGVLYLHLPCTFTIDETHEITVPGFPVAYFWQEPHQKIETVIPSLVPLDRKVFELFEYPSMGFIWQRISNQKPLVDLTFIPIFEHGTIRSGVRVSEQSAVNSAYETETERLNTLIDTIIQNGKDVQEQQRLRAYTPQQSGERWNQKRPKQLLDRFSVRDPRPPYTKNPGKSRRFV